LAAIRDSRAEPVRLPAPTAAEFTARLADELEVSLAALRSSTATYDDRRWRPGKMEPVADALWLASAGYLEVRDGVHNGRS
ncbi:MAG TPA: hypothetical protein VFX16_28060, partial [Pseudonocardiaceae bacterium]|nr:hypothetical protein [Pseudonocardiaceae bacterium]